MDAGALRDTMYRPGTRAIVITAAVALAALAALVFAPGISQQRTASRLGDASALAEANAAETTTALVTTAHIVSGSAQGSGTLQSASYRGMAVEPSARQIGLATAWAKSRHGDVAFAVIDTKGRLQGYRADQQFVSASVVKAMLLVAYLRSHPRSGDWPRATLSNMIRVSDNDAADAIYQSVGSGGLYAVARLAQMKRFSVSGWWTNAQITPADQARFFYNMDALLPKEDVAFARSLLSSIVSYQSWGIASAGRARGWDVYFKGGWRGTARGQLVHQAARLERSGSRMAIVVMTDSNPSMEYGVQTVRGVASRLLGGTH